MRNIILSITLMVSLAILSSCSSEAPEKKQVVRPVKSMIIGNAVDATGKGFPGVTKESIESKMSFRVGGPIIKFNVVEGARVKKGDLIAEIDPRDFKITLKSTMARYNQAKAESDRYKRLWKKGSVAKNDYDTRYATYLEAKSNWEDAKNGLNDTKLYAPFSGFYGAKLAEVGDKVRVKEAITTIVDLTVIEVNTTIPEQLAVQFQNFDTFEVRIEAYPDAVFKATLKNLEKKPTPEGYPLHLYLNHTNYPEDKTQMKVAAGMSCRVNISLKKTEGAVAAIIVPLTAIFESGTEKVTTVWVINPDDNTVKKQKIVMGAIVGNNAIKITEGLSLGHQIVIAGVHRLSEGDEVNFVDILK